MALVASGPGAFGWRRSAAAAFDLDAHRPGVFGPRAELELAVRYPAAGRLAGVARLRNLADDDVVVVDGLPVTCIGRTLIDLGTVSSADLVERAAESALRRGLLTDAELRRLAGLRGFHGIAALRTVMSRRPVGAPATGSDLETLMVQLIRRAGLPDPERQLPQLLGPTYRLDLAWPRYRVSVEVDGRSAHGPEQFVNDRRRQNKVVLAHWMVLRFTYDDIVGSPQLTVAVLCEGLRQRGWEGPGRR